MLFFYDFVSSVENRKTQKKTVLFFVFQAMAVNGDWCIFASETGYRRLVRYILSLLKTYKRLT